MKDLVEATTETQPRTIGVLDLRFGGTSQLQNLYQEGASKALFLENKMALKQFVLIRLVESPAGYIDRSPQKNT